MYSFNLGLQFQEILKNNAGKVVLHYLDKSYSYTELDARASLLRRYLIQIGVGRGDVLCIINHKEFDSYAIMLACLQLGVAYVNIDPDNPEDRVRKIINRCVPTVIFSDSNENHFESLIQNADIHYFNSSDIHGLDNIVPTEIYEFDGNTIAYIMFTSGSTGEPKGVAITHQNLSHFICWVRGRYNISEKDNFANLSPMYFDNSVFDFYGALFSGASLTPVKKNIVENPVELIRFVEKMGCTIWFSVPSLLIYLINMKVLKKGVLSEIRVFTFGGEGFPKSILKKLYEDFKDSAKLVNVYGPTEGTCICSSYDIKESDFEDMNSLPSLGKINPNFSYEITSKFKDGVGELIIIGPNIAAGYYNLPERTKKSFGIYKKGKFYMNRYYKTGDLVKEKDGLLYFIGRKDNQIKHMGYRIELDEIEYAINKIDGVLESAVIYQRLNESYGKIMAYIAMENIQEDRLKNELAQYLPKYMVPNKFMFMSKLPKNSNGKIDRLSLKEL